MGLSSRELGHRRAPLPAVAPLALACAVACEPSVKTIPPLGEVLVVVDTDMPVPRMVSRLRVDLYTPDHIWYVTRDVSLPRASDWPASFSVFVPEGAPTRDVLVRLRAYPQGEVRDYRGERFASRPTDGDPFAVSPPPPATGLPRLTSEQQTESTPPTEPVPELAIDRLVRVRVRPGIKASARVVLTGECVGTMADLANEATCVDVENERVPAAEVQTSADMTRPTTSLAGSFHVTEPCTATPRAASLGAGGLPLYDEEVCVDGAIFVLGSDDGFGFGDLDAAKKRVAILPPFRMDRYEVTVGRYRDAIARGFTVPDAPITNDEPIPRDGTVSSDPRSCTWSSSPMGREDFPMVCLTFASAQAFCRWTGGDLPSEAEWEYVAMEAGRVSETPFPWGGDVGVTARCDQTVIGRGGLPINNECNKDGTHYGLVSTTESIGRDVSLGLGVVGLAGSVTEMTRDAYAPYSANCWARQPLRSPSCAERSSRYTIRGGAWTLPAHSVFSARRFPLAVSTPSSEIGFRCVRTGN